MLDKCPACGEPVKSAAEMFCPSCAEPLFSREGPGGNPGEERRVSPAEPYRVQVPQEALQRPLAPPPVSPRQAASPGAAYQRKSRVRTIIFAVVGVALLAAVYLIGSSLLFKPVKVQEAMSMPAPMGWDEAPEEERASLQGTLRMARENVVVDYLIFSPSRETQLIVAEFPAGDSQLRLPDTESLSEMEAYVDENDFMLEEFARSASPSVTGVDIRALELDCGSVAVNLTINDSGNANQGKNVTELLLFNRDGYIYEVMIVDYTMMNAAATKAFVARNLEFK